MPAVTRNVFAIDSPVNASSTNAIVTPVNAEYPANSNDAVDAAIFSTRVDSTTTSPSCAAISPQNSSRLVATALTITGEPAMNHAEAAVMARPTHIHP